jgi:class 3 adenylate cyclase
VTTAQTVDIGWLLVCAALVLFMQAGFTALESGLVRSKNSINVAIKNFANFLVAASLFWVIAERVGDHAWNELASAQERATRAELARFGGEEINTTGDGFLVAFDSPARAIRCALAVMIRLDSLGLRIRAGVHTGEVEQVDGRTRGIALALASRIAARANPSEVLASATTRELAAGSALIFSDRGEHLLDGVAERRRLALSDESGLVRRA